MARLTPPANSSTDPVDDALVQFDGDHRECVRDLLRLVGELDLELLRTRIALHGANESTSYGYVRTAKQSL